MNIRHEKVLPNPMHKELMLELAQVMDRYKNDGMPETEIVGVLCQTAGVLITYLLPPEAYDDAVDNCVKNLREVLK